MQLKLHELETSHEERSSDCNCVAMKKVSAIWVHLDVSSRATSTDLSLVMFENQTLTLLGAMPSSMILTASICD